MTIGCLFFLAAGSALAQAPNTPARAAPAQAPAVSPPAQSAPSVVSSEPQQTTAAFGDWVLRCVRQSEGAQTTRLCEVAQTLQVQGQQGPIAQIAFGKTDRAAPIRIVAMLPSNVSFPSLVKLMGEENDLQPVDLAWRRCIPGACVADAEISAPLLQKLRSRNEGGRLTFKDAGGRDIALPLSLRGLPQALDALQREGG